MHSSQRTSVKALAIAINRGANIPRPWGVDFEGGAVCVRAPSSSLPQGSLDA